MGLKEEPTPEEQDGMRILHAAYKRWEDMAPVVLTISRADAYGVMMACQGMITHPAMPDKVAEQLEHIGRQIMEAICDDPALYAMSAAGWDRAFDVEPKTERRRD